MPGLRKGSAARQRKCHQFQSLDLGSEELWASSLIMVYTHDLASILWFTHDLAAILRFTRDFLVGHHQIFDINVPHTVHKDIDTDRRTYYISQNFDIVPLGLSH